MALHHSRMLPTMNRNFVSMHKQDVLLARQPIYDKERNIVGYELLFRDPETFSRQNPQAAFDGNRATSSVLLNLFTESDLNSVTGGLPAYINFTEELIHTPPLIDADALVIEILEDIPVTDRLVESLKSLKKNGYTLALDDFAMGAQYEAILPLIDIVKLELPALDDASLAQALTSLRKYPLKLLAEKVETPEQFKRCVELGCDLFQGYFLSKPEDVKGRKLATSKLAVIQLISEIQNPEVDIPGLTRVIMKDPALSFKLLKLVNSAAFRRSREIESIQMAVALLGLDRVKSWASLLALSKIDDKPQALHMLALVRALMSEKLAEFIAPQLSDRFYTVGLLSCLDAFFDQALAEIVQGISLDQTTREALLDHSGPAGLALSTTLLFEQCLWHKIDWAALAKYQLTAKHLNDIYLEASQLALETSKS